MTSRGVSYCVRSRLDGKDQTIETVSVEGSDAPHVQLVVRKDGDGSSAGGGAQDRAGQAGDGDLGTAGGAVRVGRHQLARVQVLRRTDACLMSPTDKDLSG